MATKKYKLYVVPVSWSNGRVLKYRAHIESTTGRNIYGEPADTKEEAVNSLVEEGWKFSETARWISKDINDYKEK